MAKRQFGELELAILRVLKTKERMTVSQVHKKLGEKNSYNTIMTVMLRLSQKKVLAREKVGAHYEYWLIASQTNIPSFFSQLRTRLFGANISELMSYLIDTTDEISDEEFAQMQQLLAKAKEEKRKK